MNLLTAVLPGFRSLRAPLVSGYLWLFFTWLVLEGFDGLPTEDTSGFWGELFDLGDAIGPVGLAAVASFVAYMVGSVVIAVSQQLGIGIGRLLARIYARLWMQFRKDQAWRPLPTHLVRARIPSFGVIEAPLKYSVFYNPDDCGFLGGGAGARRGLNEIAERETEKAVTELRTAIDATDGGRALLAKAILDPSEIQVHVKRSRDRTDDASDYEGVFGSDYGAFIWQGVNQPPLNAPQFSAARDIFGERRYILSRLLKDSEQVANLLDQQDAESELRLALALPTAAVILAIAARSGEGALIFLLAIPWLLAWHGIILRREANRGLVNVLVRQPSEKLNELVPAYEQFRHDAAQLTERIRTPEVETHPFFGG